MKLSAKLQNNLLLKRKRNYMTVTAKQVQDLRKMSGAGMMDCKAALAENNADIDLAFKWLREKGIAKAQKKSTRDANEGLISIMSNETGTAIVEINSETDLFQEIKIFMLLLRKLQKLSLMLKIRPKVLRMKLPLS